MLCYKCERAHACNVFRELHTMSNNFTINDCNDFDDASKYRYKRIADDDNLMKLIYDYFTDNLEGVDTEQAKVQLLQHYGRNNEVLRSPTEVFLNAN